MLYPPTHTLLRNFCVSFNLIDKEQNEGFFNPFDSAIKIKNAINITETLQSFIYF